MWGFLLSFATFACGPLALASYRIETQRLEENSKHIPHITVLVDPVKTVNRAFNGVGWRVDRVVDRPRDESGCVKVATQAIEQRKVRDPAPAGGCLPPRLQRSVASSSLRVRQGLRRPKREFGPKLRAQTSLPPVSRIRAVPAFCHGGPACFSRGRTRRYSTAWLPRFSWLPRSWRISRLRTTGVDERVHLHCDWRLNRGAARLYSKLLPVPGRYCEARLEERWGAHR